MEIRPVQAGAAPPERKRALEELARDVVEKGAEVTAPRRFLPFWHRTVLPEEAGEKLAEGETHLHIQLPGQATLPLRTPEDLEEAAVFTGVIAPKPGSTSEQLLQLSGQGYQFCDDQGRALGPYGAYNALTDPAFELTGLKARNQNGAIPLDTEVRLGELHQFTQTPVAQLEAGGYQFFQNGKLMPAFLAPQGEVGKDGERWLEAGDPATLQDRLKRFDERLSRLGKVELVRRLEAPFEPSDVPNLVKGLLAEDRDALASLALDELARDRGAVRLLAAGGAAGDDPGLQRLWLKAAAPTHAGAAVALAVHQVEFARDTAWRAARGGHDTGPGMATFLLADCDKLPWQQRNQLGAAVLQGLADSGHQAARAAVSWRASDSVAVVKQLLSPGNASLEQIAARSISSYDAEAQRRFMDQLQGPLTRDLIGLHQKLNGDSAFHPVFQAACGQPTDLAKTVGDLHAKLSRASMNWDDRRAAGTWMLDTLAQQPATKRAAETVRQWQTSDPFQAAGIVLQDPNASDDAIALKAIASYDADAQRRYMQGLPGGLTPSLLKLHQKLNGDQAYHPVFKVAATQPAAASGVEAAGHLGKILADARRGSMNWQDRRALGEGVLDLLAAFPDTKATAQLVRDWKLQDPFSAAEAVCAHPSLSTPQEFDALALAAIGTWDVAAQERHLAQLVARPGAPSWMGPMQELHQKLKGEQARGVVWTLAAQGNTVDLKQLEQKLRAANLTWEDSKVVEGLARRIEAEAEVRQLAQGLQEKNQTIAVEQDRVTIGGVVIRRKAERPPTDSASSPAPA